MLRFLHLAENFANLKSAKQRADCIVHLGVVITLKLQNFYLQIQ